MTKTISKQKQRKLAKKKRINYGMEATRAQLISFLLNNYQVLDFEIIDKINKITNIRPPIMTDNDVIVVGIDSRFKRILKRKLERLVNRRIHKLYDELLYYFIGKIDSLLNSDEMMLDVFETCDKVVIFNKLKNMTLSQLNSLYLSLKENIDS